MQEIWEWVYTIFIMAAIIFLVRAFVFDAVRVEGSSMYPTLEDNDRLIVTKLGYTPEQGDIIVLDSTYVKRQEYYSNIAEANGEDELSWFEKISAYRDISDELGTVYYVKRIIALPGQSIDLGDDGKVYIDGEALDEAYYDGDTFPIDSNMTFPLTVAEDTVFVMGDNRMHSKDSRSSDLGLVPYDAILGEAQVRVYPFDNMAILE